ncbi:MAG TPA: MBL fold metallo-hydrolase [Bacteroidales bacterium]|nr:MBL fold metallo-hydrolase [Bacteroidales bacterium]
MSGISKNTVKFLGAAGTVTGSKYLLTLNDKKILVDCGLFQGLKYLRELNWMDFHLNPSEIDCVLLTHGHLDHCGYLPRIVKQGFNGPIYSTFPTADLTAIILKDSAKIQEEDAEYANEHGYSKHEPALPLYDLEDAEKALELLHPIEVDTFFSLCDEIKFRFRHNAHIPGAAFIELVVNDKMIVFSGDIGRPSDPMLLPPETPEKADYLFVESTYGDREHSNESTEDILLRIINDSLGKHGPLFVSSFTVDRAQDFMYLIWKLKQAKKIPNIPVYLDSPMGADVSKLFLKYPQWLSMNPRDFLNVFKNTLIVHSMGETKMLTKNKNPHIVIAGSGMMNGGRILTYLEAQLGNPRATFILPGYQAEGTRGRDLSEGASSIKVRGKFYNVEATIEHITTMSSHADRSELINWLSHLESAPKKVFIVHGEKSGAEGLKQKLEEVYGWNCIIPQLNDEFELSL